MVVDKRAKSPLCTAPPNMCKMCRWKGGTVFIAAPFNFITRLRQLERSPWCMMRLFLLAPFSLYLGGPKTELLSASIRCAILKLLWILYAKKREWTLSSTPARSLYTSIKWHPLPQPVIVYICLCSGSVPVARTVSSRWWAICHFFLGVVASTRLKGEMHPWHFQSLHLSNEDCPLLMQG